jgi:hypothetical protein
LGPAGAETLRPGYPPVVRRALPLVAVAALVGAAAGGAANSPQLHLAAMRPFTVAGSGFVAGESVRLVATVRDEPRVKVRVASPAGRFGAAFRGVAVDPCTTFVVRARGTKGSRALLRSKSLTECPEPLGP